MHIPNFFLLTLSLSRIFPFSLSTGGRGTPGSNCGGEGEGERGRGGERRMGKGETEGGGREGEGGEIHTLLIQVHCMCVAKGECLRNYNVHVLITPRFHIPADRQMVPYTACLRMYW